MGLKMTSLLNMPHKTMMAALLFVAAKVLGIVGIIMGFVPGTVRVLGGISLGLAVVALLTSIGLSLYQMKQDKLRFEEEDDCSTRIKVLRRTEEKLKKQLQELESKVVRST